MRSSEAVHRHARGVFAAAYVLLVTVVLAIVIGGVLLLGIGAKESEGSIVASSPVSSGPAPEAPRKAPSSSLSGEAPAKKAPATTSAPPPTTAPAAPTTVVPTSTTAPPTPAGAAPAVAAPGGALCIGDSVMLGASPQYSNTLTMCGTVDATVSRAWSSAGPVVRGRPHPDRVVIHLGTNGFTDAGEIDAVLAALAGVPRVVLVNVQLNGTRRWEQSVNAEIAAAAQRWSNVRIADWKAASSGHREYFRGDNIHPSQAGALVYAGVISAAL